MPDYQFNRMMGYEIDFEPKSPIERMIYNDYKQIQQIEKHNSNIKENPMIFQENDIITLNSNMIKDEFQKRLLVTKVHGNRVSLKILGSNEGVNLNHSTLLDFGAVLVAKRVKKKKGIFGLWDVKKDEYEIIECEDLDGRS